MESGHLSLNPNTTGKVCELCVCLVLMFLLPNIKCDIANQMRTVIRRYVTRIIILNTSTYVANICTIDFDSENCVRDGG